MDRQMRGRRKEKNKMKALTIQKLVGIAILIATVIIVAVTGEGTIGIFLGIIGIGLIVSKEIYLEPLKEMEVKEREQRRQNSIQKRAS